MIDDLERMGRVDNAVRALLHALAVDGGVDSVEVLCVCADVIARTADTAGWSYAETAAVLDRLATLVEELLSLTNLPPEEVN